MEKNAELVFVPAQGMGHLIPAVELAKKLVDQSPQISVSILVMKQPMDEDVNSYIHSLESDAFPITSTRLKFVHLPQPQNQPGTGFTQLVESYEPIIRDAMKDRVSGQLTQPAGSPRLAGFVLDMFCTAIIDVANELGVPSYVFLTSNASFMCLMSYMLSSADDHGVDVVNEFNKPDIELDVPGYRNRVPGKVLPSVLFESDTSSTLFNNARRYKETKGILANSFVELESHALESLYEDDKVPLVYPVGPIISLGRPRDRPSQPDEKRDSIMDWLDGQPPSSVVFLCFGSRGSFNEDQVKEIAIGLQRSGHRFLWSLRRPGKIGEFSPPVEYEPEELRDIVMPDGFLDETSEIGKVIGWAPQAEVLAHRSIGAFVSHCGWNSTLESLWFGVPVVAWPLYAEQQLNAFEFVKEYGLAVEMKMDYKWDIKEQTSNVKVTAEEVEEAVKKVMGEEGMEVRKKAREMKEKSRAAVSEGGSSYGSIRKFIDDVVNDMPCL